MLEDLKFDNAAIYTCKEDFYYTVNLGKRTKKGNMALTRADVTVNPVLGGHPKRGPKFGFQD